MKTKIFNGNQYRGSFSIRWYNKWKNFKRNAIIFLKQGLLGLVAAIFLTGSFYLGGYLNPVTKIEAMEVEVPSKDTPPIMKKIATCESNNSHYDKNGQVLINKSQDAGRFQINIPIWGKKAKEMGLDLMNEKDNETFAMWLFNNYGSTQWVHSSHCWNR